jgi:hypothetical protein
MEGALFDPLKKHAVGVLKITGRGSEKSNHNL